MRNAISPTIPALSLTPAITTEPSKPFADEIDWAALDAAAGGSDGVPQHVEWETTERTEPARVESTWGQTVVQEGAARLARTEDSILAAAGIESSDSLAARGEQFFETGTALADIGHANLEAAHAKFLALPPPATAIADFKALIEAEARRDRVIDLAHCRLNLDGQLVAGNDIDVDKRENGDWFHFGPGINVERAAWSALVEVAGGPNVNAGLSKRKRGERRVRTRQLGDIRSAFAIVSSDPKRGYQVLDGDQVADLVLAGLKDAGQLSGARAEVKYDAETTRYDIRVMVAAPIDINAFRGVGRVHQFYMSIRGGDNGSTSISGRMGAIRLRCLNASLSEADGTAWTRIHRGDGTELRRLVADMPSKFGEVARSLQDVWARAAAEHFLDSDGGRLSVQEAITRLVAHDYIPRGGLELDAAVDHYMAAWRAEDSPHSAAGVIMAVQRAAHEATWRTSWAQEDIEDAASHLLYQPVWVLDEAVA